MIGKDICFVISAASFKELSFFAIAKTSHDVEIELMPAEKPKYYSENKRQM